MDRIGANQLPIPTTQWLGRTTIAAVRIAHTSRGPMVCSAIASAAFSPPGVAGGTTELAQLRTDVEHLVRVVNQLTAHDRQLLHSLSQPNPPIRTLPPQPHLGRSH